MVKVSALLILLWSLSFNMACTSTRKEDNPILKEWSGPYKGGPPFDQIEFDHFRHALDEPMIRTLLDYDRVAKNAEKPSFENTILEIEKIETEKMRMLTPYYVWSGGLNSEEFKELAKEYAPKFAEIKDKIVQNEMLFKRIKALPRPQKGQLHARTKAPH